MAQIDEVGKMDILETMCALLEARMAGYRRRKPYRDRESTVVGVLAGALLFEETDDPEEIRACCREALFRLGGGLSQEEELPVIEDPDSIRRYLMKQLKAYRS